MGVSEPFSVVVPYRPDGAHRDLSWAWVRERWRSLLPEAEVVVATDGGGSDPAQFNHPLAINRAVQEATHPVLVVADADTAFDPHWVRSAVKSVRIGQARWALPLEYRKIDQVSSANILAQTPLIDPLPAHECDWTGQQRWSGLVVVPREGFDIAGGYDERFDWWGGDDHCFGIAMGALWGPPTWMPHGVAYHLWHPPQETISADRPGVISVRDVHRRYIEAAGDPDAIRELIESRS